MAAHPRNYVIAASVFLVGFYCCFDSLLGAGSIVQSRERAYQRNVLIFLYPAPLFLWYWWRSIQGSC